MRTIIRTVNVLLPGHLCRLAALDSRSLAVQLTAAVVGREFTGQEFTVNDVIGALERVHPALAGALREPAPAQADPGSPPGAGFRLRPYVRVFAGPADLTRAGLEAVLPPAVLEGDEPVRFVGAIAGG